MGGIRGVDDDRDHRSISGLLAVNQWTATTTTTTHSIIAQHMPAPSTQSQSTPHQSTPLNLLGAIVIVVVVVVVVVLVAVCCCM